MSKAKTRFTIAVNGKARELFSVRQLNNGDLLIICRTGVNHEGNDGTDHPQQTDRISVHHSPASTGTTIKSTIKLESGATIPRHAFIRNSKDHLIWPLRFSRSQDLSHERYIAQARPADTLVDLGTYHPEWSTLMHALVVARPSSPLPHSPAFSFHQHNFREFKLGIYTAYMLIPSFNTGDFTFPMTTSKPLDGIPIWQPGGADSLQWPALATLIGRQFVILGGTYFARMQKLATDRTLRDELFTTFVPFAIKNMQDFNEKFTGKVAALLPTDNGSGRFYLRDSA